MKLNITCPDLQYYITRLETEPFSFIRYGDGEFQAMDILPHKFNYNCDKHEYFPELGKELRKTLELNDKNFVRAIGHTATENEGNILVEEYLVDNNLSLDWHDTEVFLNASLAGELNPFVSYLREKNILYICPEKLESFVRKELGVKGTVTIPSVNCYLHIDSILREILYLVDKNNYDIILFSAGMVSNVLIYRLFTEYNIKMSMLDIGSTFDGYVKSYSRTHTRLLSQKNKTKNLRK